MLNVLLYGSRGYIGSSLAAYLLANNIVVAHGAARLDDVAALRLELQVWLTSTSYDKYVVNCAGRCRGTEEGEEPNIDYFEHNIHRRFEENVRDNIFAPVQLALLCDELDIPHMYVGTGCIFEKGDGDDGSRNSNSERDHTIVPTNAVPTYTKTKYSLAKRTTDCLLHALAQKSKSKQTLVRIRLPFDDSSLAQSLLCKMRKFKYLNDAENSMTYLPSAFQFMLYVMQNPSQWGAVYNATHITSASLRSLYRTMYMIMNMPKYNKDEPRPPSLSPRCNVVIESSLSTREYQDITSALLSALYNGAAGNMWHIYKRWHTFRYVIAVHIGSYAIYESEIMPRLQKFMRWCHQHGHGRAHLILTIAGDFAFPNHTEEQYKDILTLHAHECQQAQWGYSYCSVVWVPNKGCDVGPFFEYAVPLILRTAPYAQFIGKIHTKGAPNHKNLKWRNAMFDAFFNEPKNVLLDTTGQQGVGMVGASYALRSTHKGDLAFYNAGRIAAMCRLLSIPSPFIFTKTNGPGNDDEAIKMAANMTTKELFEYIKKQKSFLKYHYSFVAGTVFWLNALHWIPWLRKHCDALADFGESMEPGKPNDSVAQSNAHAGERLFGVICAAMHWDVRGVS